MRRQNLKEGDVVYYFLPSDPNCRGTSESRRKILTCIVDSCVETPAPSAYTDAFGQNYAVTTTEAGINRSFMICDYHFSEGYCFHSRKNAERAVLAAGFELEGEQNNDI